MSSSPALIRHTTATHPHEKMTALPSAADAPPLLLGGSPIPQALSVYEHVILPAESAALLKAEEAPIVYARVLGYLLLYPPSDEARRCLTLELASCNSTDDPSKAVFQLGAVYVAYFIGICKLLFSPSRALKYTEPLYVSKTHEGNIPCCLFSSVQTVVRSCIGRMHQRPPARPTKSHQCEGLRTDHFFLAA